MRDYAEIAHNLRCCVVGVPCDDCTYQNDITKCASLEGQAADAIEELLSKVPHWISVEKRLPEENYAVLGYCQKNQCVFTVFRQGEHWMHFAEHTTPVFYPVTHWMQLPESPKEVE